MERGEGAEGEKPRPDAGFGKNAVEAVRR